jgi:hypothetical protein
MPNIVPPFIAVLGALMIPGAVWRYRQRDMVGMCACLLIVEFAVVMLVLRTRP